MNQRQLEAFRATVRSGSVTEAASMMHISQPSVSRLLADLERSVGFPMFVRVGRGLAPTVEGQQFYRAVEGMFVGIERLRELARSIKTAPGGSISIGSMLSVSAVELPTAVGKMYRENPDLHFLIHSRNTPTILDAIQMGQMDLGVVGREPGYRGVETLFETAAPYVCLFPEDHHLAEESGPVDLNALSRTETFVTFGGSYPDSMMSIDSALSQKLRTGSRLSVTNLPLAGALVREAGVLAIVDPFTAEQVVRMGDVVFRPLVQDLTYHVAIIAPSRDRISRPALQFADLLQQQLSSRVKHFRGLR